MKTIPTPQTGRRTGRRRRARYADALPSLLLAAGALAMLSLAACRDADPADEVGVAAGQVEQGEATVAYYDPDLQIDTDAGGPGPLATGSSVVEVLLHDRHIALPDSLPQGKVTFLATNTGSEAHSLAIAGEGGEYELEAPLAPGESGEIELLLDAGVYRVYCPLDTHGREGMIQRLRVTQ